MITTNGLIGYWHSMRGINGDTWENISPNTKGSNNAKITGAVVIDNSLYLDSIDDIIEIEGLNVTATGVFTIEFIAKNMGTSTVPTLLFNVNHDETSGIHLYYLKMNNVPNEVGYWHGDIGGEGIDVYSRKSSSLEYQNVTCTYDNSTNKIEIYLDGIKVHEQVTNVLLPQQLNKVMIGHIKLDNSYQSAYGFKGNISSVKIYNRVLSQSEIQQNFAVGRDVGLEELPQESPPKVLSISIDKYKIGPKEEISKIMFDFDKDVVQWKVNVFGSSHDTGTTIESGFELPAKVKAIIEVHWTELQQEELNRLNIYGLGSDGQWTIYE